MDFFLFIQPGMTRNKTNEVNCVTMIGNGGKNCWAININETDAKRMLKFGVKSNYTSSCFTRSTKITIIKGFLCEFGAKLCFEFHFVHIYVILVQVLLKYTIIHCKQWKTNREICAHRQTHTKKTIEQSAWTSEAFWDEMLLQCKTCIGW